MMTSRVGGLIQTATGLAGGRVARRTRHSGVARKALLSRPARGIDFIGLPIMNLVWRHKADTEMTAYSAAAAHIFRHEAGHRTDLKSASIPI